MKTGRVTLADLFGNRHLEQLVVPEIQRDYVWGKDQTTHLITSVIANFEQWRQWLADPQFRVVIEAQPSNKDQTEDENETIERDFAEFLARRRHATNVGFIYAYCDSDLPGQFYLIDGQQRLTTLFLALLATAKKDHALIARFQARYLLAGPTKDVAPDSAVPTKLDYRLRDHTTKFLHRFVHHCLNVDSDEEITDQAWYLRRFSTDTTTKNLLANYAVIQGLLCAEASPIDPVQFFGYLEELVDCWYFDTNESSQGEELYLYLNARGESLADNENLKARLLDQLAEKDAKELWGRKWEEWQDFFWRHRQTGLGEKDQNPNADRGFNIFLSCIQYLERLQPGASTEDAKLEEVEQYIQVLQWLELNKGHLRELYSYSAWVEDWFSKVWGILNAPTPVDWAKSLLDTVLVCGSLLTVHTALTEKNGNFADLDPEEVFRAIRIFYLRYHNGNRAVNDLPEIASVVLAQDITSKHTGGEEVKKWEFLVGRPTLERRQLEAAIWQIEDHRLNLNGRDMGSVNLTHLVDLDRSPTVDEL